MRFLALEIDATGAAPLAPAESDRLLRAEAVRTWELHMQGVLREIAFRADRHAAILALECADEAATRATLATLPLVRAGQISFEVMPLQPWDGWSRLFGVEG